MEMLFDDAPFFYLSGDAMWSMNKESYSFL